MKFSEILKSAHFDFKEVKNEEYLQVYEIPKNLRVIREKKPSDCPLKDNLIFVDGKIRHLFYKRYGYSTFLISQIAIGASIFSEGEGTTILEDTIATKFVVVSQFKNVEMDLKDIGGIEVEYIAEPKGDFKAAALNKMYEMELELSKELSEQKIGIVIKDGTLRPIYEVIETPVITGEYGPVGLVKNVSLSDVWDYVKDLKIGKRSVIFENDFGDYLIWGSYLRIGKHSFLRFDSVVQRGEENSFELIPCIFDNLERIIPNLTIDVDYGRLPENIYPIQAIEKRLGVNLFTPVQFLAAAEKLMI